MIQLAKIPGIPRKLHAQCPGAGRLTLGRIRAFMVSAVPPPDFKCVFAAHSGDQAGRRRKGQAGKPRRNIIDQVIQLCRRTAEIQVFLVLITNHGIHGVDCLIKEAANRTEKEQK